jgi:hypothetical protein
MTARVFSHLLAGSMLVVVLGVPVVASAQHPPWAALRCSELSDTLRGNAARPGLEQRENEIRQDIAALNAILQRDIAAANAREQLGQVAAYVTSKVTDDPLAIARAAAAMQSEEIANRIKTVKALVNTLRQEQNFLSVRISRLREIAAGVPCSQAPPIASNATLPVTVEVLDHDNDQPLNHAGVVFIVPNYQGRRLSAYTNARGEADFSGSSGIPAAYATNGVTVQASLANYAAQSSFLAPELLTGGVPRRFVVYLHRLTPGKSTNLPSIAGNWQAREDQSPGARAYNVRINEIDANGEYWGVMYKDPQNPIHFHGKLTGNTMNFSWYGIAANGSGTLIYADVNHANARWQDTGNHAGYWYLTR